MEMDDRIRELIAIGASITANCKPCLQLHVEKAIASGAAPMEVTMAMEIGNHVSKGAAARMKTHSSDLHSATQPITMGAVMEGNGCEFLGP